MNFTWVLEWWVRSQSCEWYYQNHQQEEGMMKTSGVYLLMMLDTIRDGLWHRLDHLKEIENGEREEN